MSARHTYPTGPFLLSSRFHPKEHQKNPDSLRDKFSLSLRVFAKAGRQARVLVGDRARFSAQIPIGFFHDRLKALRVAQYCFHVALLGAVGRSGAARGYRKNQHAEGA